LRAARGGSNHQLDWENLTEEIESLGKSQRSALGGHIMRIIRHLVSFSIRQLSIRATADADRSDWRGYKSAICCGITRA
jgi:hypothetical protein